MQRATREFIKARQPHCKFTLETKQVLLIGGGVSNQCYSNAFAMIESSKATSIVSGWIVKTFDPITMSTEIIQHFWNADRAGNHIDSTFGAHTRRHEYVIDMDLIDYCKKNDNRLTTHLASSLLYKDGKYHIVNETVDGSISFCAVNNLTTDILYKSKLI
jgi:hypothetical protein